MINLQQLAEELASGVVDPRNMYPGVVLDLVNRAIAAEKSLDRALTAGLEMSAEVKDIEVQLQALKEGMKASLLESFTTGRFVGREESAVAVSQMPEWSSDLGVDVLERGHAVHTIRTFVPGARDFLAVKRADVVMMKASIEGIAPPKECPFCETYPCSSCMERARVAGTLKSTLKGIDAILEETP